MKKKVEKAKKKKDGPGAHYFQQRGDRVKVALIYFLEGMLFNSDAKQNVSSVYMSMVDDLDTFNAYPWELEVFETTIHSLWSKNLLVNYKERLQKPPKRQDHHVKETYTLYGFPFAFQVSVLCFINFLISTEYYYVQRLS